MLTASAQNPGMGSGHMSPPTMDNNGSIWINTDVMTIKASTSMPSFQFWYANDENGTHAKFMAQYQTLIEFEDQNGDGAYQTGEIINFAPLSAYEWTVQSGSVTNESGAVTEVWLKYTKGGISGSQMQNPMGHMHRDYPGQGGVDKYENVTLQIWAHIYLNGYEGSVSNDNGVHANYTVAASSELKMDIEIGNFPFSTPTSQVALEVLLKENLASDSQYMNQHMFETHERTRNVTANSNMNWTTPGGNETLFQSMNQTRLQNIDFVNTGTGVPDGFFNWLDVATINWPGGYNQLVNVSASYVVTPAGMSVYLSYPHFDGGRLVHDPSIGVYEEGAPAEPTVVDYLPLLGLGLVVVLVVGIVLLRRK